MLGGNTTLRRIADRILTLMLGLVSVIRLLTDVRRDRAWTQGHSVWSTSGRHDVFGPMAIAVNRHLEEGLDR